MAMTRAGWVHMGSAAQRRRQVVEEAVAQTVSLARLTAPRPDRLGDELVRLGGLQELARVTPLAWRTVVKERQEELAFWLFNVAVGVAAAVGQGSALAILDALPAVDAGAHGRRALLEELCRYDQQRAQLA